MVEPLRGLTHNDAEFIWTERHQKVFERIKQEMSQVRTLAYSDDSKETYIITDAGPDGVAGVLAQESKDKENLSILAYYSRALTSTEKRYPQIDKEMLAIDGGTFSCVLGRSQVHYKNGSSATGVHSQEPKRQAHIPGKENPADYLSRHPVPNRDDGPARETVVVEEYVSFVLRAATPKALTVQDVEKAYKEDAQISLLVKALREGHTLRRSHERLWKDERLKPFLQIRDELTVTEANVVLRGTRLVIPENVQDQAIPLSAKRHREDETANQGKDLAPRNRQESIGSNQTLRSVPKNSSGEKDIAAWPLPGQKYLLVVVDEYSRFLVVSTLSSLNVKTVTARLSDILAVHGMPYDLKTDNGPPFFGKEFGGFLRLNGIRHHRTTPLWTQANGEVERFIRNVKKTVKAACVGGND
ncbi:uncharacterized protein K02A2.6-like [Ornithodoros turicata]|uniref:uncharacterized protein K02A2.6-like n=1 Tax=Ornithodoros turicata TaxID=34597 RepID=UPI003139ECA7